MSALLDTSNLDLSSTPNTLPPSLEQGRLQPNGHSAAAPAAVRTAQRARVIDGNHTEVIVQAFVDRVLVVITQLGRIGCMLQVNPPLPGLPTPIHSSRQSLFPQLPPPHPSSTTLSLFGIAPSQKAELLHELYATQIGAIIFATSAPDDDMVAVAGLSKPVVVAIALKPSGTDEYDESRVTEQEREVFGQVMNMVNQCRVW
ncbi:hypothetical protein OIV83_000248 [Microbotryomycetes sp. JL201]|nr:hypothetical protein OIV83_000248 [Microbotryomycetes sp. JL201]